MLTEIIVDTTEAAKILRQKAMEAIIRFSRIDKEKCKKCGKRLEWEAEFDADFPAGKYNENIGG